jgi:hypothetical protein
MQSKKNIKWLEVNVWHKKAAEIKDFPTQQLRFQQAQGSIRLAEQRMQLWMDLQWSPHILTKCGFFTTPGCDRCISKQQKDMDWDWNTSCSCSHDR